MSIPPLEERIVGIGGKQVISTPPSNVLVSELTLKFDGNDTKAKGLSVGADEIDAAFEATPQDVRDALQFAHDRIASHHARQMPGDDFYTDPLGVELGSRWTAIDAVGLYVPGGTASYPSSVLMNAVPAKVAGVERVVMVAPSQKGVLNPAVLAAAKIAREAVDEMNLKTPHKPRFVAGSMGPTNKTASMSPDVNDPGFRAVTFDELRAAYKQQAEALLDGGADILIVETIFKINTKRHVHGISHDFAVV